eukprot:gene3372-3857_t
MPAGLFAAVKKAWLELYNPVVEQCKLEIRMNLKTRSIEIRTCKETEDPTLLQ